MKKIAKWLLLGLLIIAPKLQASHLVGGFLTYEYLPPSAAGYNYRVTVFAYRDCSGTVQFDDVIGLCIYNGDKTLYKQVDVKILQKKKVDPVGNTACPEAASACLEQGIYQTTITVPASSTGYHLKWERCCRNTQTNLADNGGVAYQGQTYYGYIPPTSIANSSPYFLDVPVPFICAGDTTTIRNRALDKDGDSLSYKIVTPWQGATSGLPTVLNCASTMTPFYQVDYNGGFSGTAPFGSAGIAKVDAFNGLTTYLAPNTGRYAVCVEVTEWRNGVAISVVRLDLQILVISCGKNDKPRLKYEGGTQVWQVEVGETICKDVTAYDAKDTQQIITLKAYADIINGTNGYVGSKATLTPTVNAAVKSVTSKFCWKPDCNINTTNPYRVTFEAVDNGCPSKYVNENVLIYVKPVKIVESIIGPQVQCANALGAVYNISNNQSDHKYKWIVTGGKIVGADTATQLVVNWGTDTVGIVSLYVMNKYGCQSTPIDYRVKLLKAPSSPVITGPDTVCLQQNFSKKFTLPSSYTVSYNWNTAKLNWVSDNNAAGTFTMTFKPTTGGPNAWIAMRLANSVTYAGFPVTCYSPWDTVKVFVSTPVSSGVIGPQSVCPNNKGLIYNLDQKFAGAKYIWSSTGSTNGKVVNDTQYIIDWGGVGTGSVKVVVVDRFGCKDSSQISVLKNHALKAPKVYGDSILCALTLNVPYWVKGVQKENYNWQVTGGAFATGSNGTRVNVNWGNSGAANVQVQASAYDSVSKLPCLSPWSALKVVLKPAPAAPALNNVTICQNRTYNSFWKPIAAVSGEKIYPEIVPNGLKWKFIPSTDSSSWDIQYYGDTFGVFTVKYRLISQYGCPGPYTTANIALNPRPLSKGILGPVDVCVPNVANVRYEISQNAGSSYDWWLVEGGFTTPPVTNDYRVFVTWNLTAQPGLIGVQETSALGCLGDTQQLQVYVDQPQVKLDLVSVAPPPFADDAIIVHFQVTNAPRYNKTVLVQRRPYNSGLFTTIGQAAHTDVTFTHSNINTDVTAWEYRVAIINRCGDTIFTAPQTVVLLQGTKTGPFTMSVNFSPYFGFANGVSKYELYRSFTAGTGYTLYQTYPTPTTDNFDNGRDNFAQYFRIKAIENATQAESWSNDILINYEPVLFIPNAFTPNQKGGNEVFLPFAGGLKTFKMWIYNRWGQLLFVSDNLSAGWDGTVLGEPCMEGVYVYRIEYSDYQNRMYSTDGTLHLIR